jgi:nicotinate-nucleotide pyrophosphorylase (carboxylating)
MRIEVEVETGEELEQALVGGADAILIDNQTPEIVGAWVRRAREVRPAIFVEASGNVSLENAGAYARAGVDAISVGALTHSVRAADMSLELEMP